MSLTPGTQLGPYQIVSLLGSGGMGEVYRASDPRIGREVAIKVLPVSVAADPDRLARFQLEAKSAGALNHPNLVTIYELGLHDGAPFIVMELLEGETLREKLGDRETKSGGSFSSSTSRRTIPQRKALEFAVQLASGLAAAHEKGIIHRDLKPENIFITRDGRLKILDFGLAKLNAAVAESSESATIQKATQPGTVMGTAGYMSPEQVRGQQVDHRSDVFSFGAILYEMIAGRRAFFGDSSVETMNAILTQDPPELERTDGGVAPAFERVIRRCLEKSPEERFYSAHDIAFALEALSGGVGSGSSASLARPAARRRWEIAAVAGGLGGIVLIALLLGFSRAGEAPAGVSPMVAASFLQLTHEEGLELEPSISPDGRSFAYVVYGDRGADIFLRRVDGRNPINLTKNPDEFDVHPAFSPDGERIAFASTRGGGGIFIMGATGESVRRISDTGFNPSWSPDGKRIAYSSDSFFEPTSRNGFGAIWIIDLASGERRQLLEESIFDAVQPQWSPGGSRLAFWGIDDGGRREIFTVAVDDPRAVALRVPTEEGINWNPIWSPDGRFLYYASDRNGTMNLWRIAIDEKSGETEGAAEPILTPSPWSGWFSISRDGKRLAYATSEVRSKLEWFDFDSEKLAVTSPPRRVFAGSLQVRNFAPSADGEWVAFTTGGTKEDLFVVRADGSDLRQLTNDAHRYRGPEWSPDGNAIAFYSNRSGQYDVWTIRPDGSGLTQISAIGGVWFPHWSPDGKQIASSNPGAAWIFDLSKPLPIREGKPLTSGMSISGWLPDGSGLTGIRPMTGSVSGGIETLTLSDGGRTSYEAVGAFVRPLLDGRRLLFAIPEAKQLGVLDRITGEVRRGMEIPIAARQGGAPVMLARNDSRLFIYDQALESNIWLLELGPPAE
jgi:eukaryotic-like serine/threonine-protein kinase